VSGGDEAAAAGARAGIADPRAGGRRPDDAAAAARVSEPERTRQSPRSPSRRRCPTPSRTPRPRSRSQRRSRRSSPNLSGSGSRSAPQPRPRSTLATSNRLARGSSPRPGPIGAPAVVGGDRCLLSRHRDRAVGPRPPPPPDRAGISIAGVARPGRREALAPRPACRPRRRRHRARTAMRARDDEARRRAARRRAVRVTGVARG